MFLGLPVRDCEPGYFPMTRGRGTMAISSYLGNACKEITSLKDREWWYKGTAQKKLFRGKETVWGGY